MSVAPYPYDPIRYGDVPTYAGREVLRGRMRAAVSVELFDATCDRSGHDSGDESRDLEHQVLTEREALLAADMADEEQRDHERSVRERDADIQPFTMGAMQ
jgi:hypothetical protein